jgi:sterol desaturase/sphingolipid hydroxylase (fatty acid hydroxylase superfamily)
VHHKNINPSSWSDSILAEIVDWTISGFIYFAPLLFLEPTIIVFITLSWVATQIQINHSGFMVMKIPYIISSLEHWGHHRYYKVNYSELTTIPDQLFGTYMSEEQIKHNERKRKLMNSGMY